LHLIATAATVRRLFMAPALGLTLLLLGPIGAAAQDSVRPKLVIPPLLETEAASESSLEIRLAGPAVPNGSIVEINGLPPSVSLSHGKSVGKGRWDVPVAALDQLKLIVPAEVSGRSELIVTLVTSTYVVLAEEMSSLVVAPPRAAAAEKPAGERSAAQAGTGQASPQGDGTAGDAAKTATEAASPKPDAPVSPGAGTQAQPSPDSKADSQTASDKPDEPKAAEPERRAEPSVDDTAKPAPTETAKTETGNDASPKTATSDAAKTEQPAQDQAAQPSADAKPAGTDDKQTSAATAAPKSADDEQKPSETAARTEQSEKPLAPAEQKQPAERQSVASAAPIPNPPEQSRNASSASAREAPPALSDAQRAQAVRLLEQGERYVAQGNIVVARQYFLRAADRGLAEAAMRMAETHDPNQLAQLNVQGLLPDVAQARIWYTRAAALGASEAEARLRALEGR
jgi:hypothetical protein